MARKVIWSETAWDDLQEIAEYIARDSPNYSAAFVREARDAARSLSTFFERGRIVPEAGDPSIREIFVRSYRLIYQISKEEVSIIGFVHGARDLQKLWMGKSDL